MKDAVLVVGIILKTYGGHTSFINGLLNSGLPYEFMHFSSARPPKNRSSSTEPGYFEVLDAGITRTIRGALITLYHLLLFPLVIIRERPQLVHLAGGTYWPFWEYAIYIQICKLVRIKTIYHWLANFNEFYNSSGRISRFFLSHVLRQVDRHIVLSKIDMECMATVVGEDRIHLLPSAVSRTFIDQFGNESGGSNSREFRLLFVGGRDPVRKGINTVLKAMELLAHQDERFRLVLTGGGNVRHTLERNITQGMMESVSYLGYVNDANKIDLYKSSSLLLLPSVDEGLPYVIVEAMAAGLPVISTPVGGIPDIVEDGVNGFLISPGDYEDLAQKITLLITDQRLREQIGQANRHKIEEQYSEEVVFERLGHLYIGLLNHL